MQELDENANAFATFRALNGEANHTERDQLFRNMAQLYSHVSDRCDDGQVRQYDQVLCQLSDLVEEEARAFVAKVLAPLERAPGQVVVKLARDKIEVARPLLEFSKVLSDDDLIDIIQSGTEAHRAAIAGRRPIGERVGDAIVIHGGNESVVRLVRNTSARLGVEALDKLVLRAANDTLIASDLRNRVDIDWKAVAAQISAASQSVMRELNLSADPATSKLLNKANTIVYNRMRNRVGFNAQDWKLAWNQVKALSDRGQLDSSAAVRYARYGYGHHAAAALTMLFEAPPEVLVKWLAGQDYVAMTVALRALDVSPDMVQPIFVALPWRDMPTMLDISNVIIRYEALGVPEAQEIFSMWRQHAFRKLSASGRKTSAA